MDYPSRIGSDFLERFLEIYLGIRREIGTLRFKSKLLARDGVFSLPDSQEWVLKRVSWIHISVASEIRFGLIWLLAKPCRFRFRLRPR